MIGRRLPPLLRAARGVERLNFAALHGNLSAKRRALSPQPIALFPLVQQLASKPLKGGALTGTPAAGR